VRDMMERQVGHMVHLIDDLLDIARISGGKLELKRQRTDLAAILASAVETSMPLIEAGKHAFTLDVPDAALPVDADATRIAQVVANLLNNAAKYTPPGGQIALSAQRDGLDIVITVRDSGVGIAADALAGVFEMFSQIGRTVDRSQGGLGIGLSLVRRLVEMHGGSVAATSAGANAGSIFTVRLPLAADAVQAGPAPGEPAPALDNAAGGLRGAGRRAGVRPARGVSGHRHAGHERLRDGARDPRHAGPGRHRAGSADRLGRRERPPALERGGI
jgi:signal transduction histidine kinase